MKDDIALLERLISNDPRQAGHPFTSLIATRQHLLANPRLRLCPHCKGDRCICGLMSSWGCERCGGRGVIRRQWWKFWVPLPLSFYDEEPSHERS